MTTLKEIAALFRLYVDEIAKVRVDQIEQHPYLPEAQEAADQLEALAASEPVAEILVGANGHVVDVTGQMTELPQGWNKVYAAPQRMTVSREAVDASIVAFKVALMQSECALVDRVNHSETSNDDAELARLDEAYAQRNAEVICLYARALGIELRDEG